MLSLGGPVYRSLVAGVVLLLAVGCGGGGPSRDVITAQQVVDHFEDEGIDVPDARDTSETCSAPEVCTTRMTTMLVTVHGFDSEELAKAFSEQTGETYQAGAVVLSYRESPASKERQREYNDALDELVA